MQYSISDLKQRIESTYTTTPTTAPASTSTIAPETVRERNIDGHTKTTQDVMPDTESDLEQEHDFATDLAVIDSDHNVESDRYIKIVSWSGNIVEETVALHRLLGKRLPGSRQLIAGDLTSNRPVCISASSLDTSTCAAPRDSSAISPDIHHQSETVEQSDTGTPYRFRSTLMSRQNRFLRECSTRVRMS